MKRVFAHIGFSFAISMLVLNLIPAKYDYYLMAGLAVLLIASLLIKKYRQALAVPVCLGAAVFACLIFIITLNSYVTPTQRLNNENAQCEFYITELPQKDENGEYSYIIKTTKIDYPNAPQNIKVRLKTKKPINCKSYQLIKGRLVFHSIADNALASYGYWGKNIYLSAKPYYYSSKDSPVNSPMKHFIDARQKIKNRLSIIGGEEASVSQALCIGDKSEISSKLYSDFKLAGAAHLMAVSGLHLTAISGFLLFILKKLKLNKKLSFALMLGVIAYYCALCGFSKSVVRAGIMLSILMLGEISDKHSDPLNSLGLAAFIICINPFAVCDVGAVLSVLCVLSLCTAYPYFNRKIGGLRLTKSRAFNITSVYILKAVAAAFCIMVYSLCAMFIFFGYFSLTSLVSGIVLVPLGSAATILAIATSFFASTKAGIIFIVLSRITNRTIIILVEKFASFRFSVINFENYFGLVASLILIILAICFIINKKYIKKAIAFSLVLAVAVLSAMAITNSKATYAYVTENGAIAVCDKQNAVVFGVKSIGDYYGINKFISTRGAKLDLIACDAKNKYTSMLADEFSCEITKYKTYSKTYSESFSVDYKTNKEKYNFTVKANHISISKNNTSSLSSDINITNKNCFDKNGYIDLTKGDIIYRISNKNYSTRRVNIWQE